MVLDYGDHESNVAGWPPKGHSRFYYLILYVKKCHKHSPDNNYLYDIYKIISFFVR